MSRKRAQYILVVAGHIVRSGDDSRVLIGQWALHNPRISAVVKPWRDHVWVDGIPRTIHNMEHCEACKKIRPKNETKTDPCRMPENVDQDVELIEYHAPHTPDRCCPVHDHHVNQGYPHNNCILR